MFYETGALNISYQLFAYPLMDLLIGAGNLYSSTESINFFLLTIIHHWIMYLHCWYELLWENIPLYLKGNNHNTITLLKKKRNIKFNTYNFFTSNGVNVSYKK